MCIACLPNLDFSLAAGDVIFSLTRGRQARIRPSLFLHSFNKWTAPVSLELLIRFGINSRIFIYRRKVLFLLLSTVSPTWTTISHPEPVLKPQNILGAQQRSVTSGVLVQLKWLVSGTGLLFWFWQNFREWKSWVSVRAGIRIWDSTDRSWQGFWEEIEMWASFPRTIYAKQYLVQVSTHKLGRSMWQSASIMDY